MRGLGSPSPHLVLAKLPSCGTPSQTSPGVAPELCCGSLSRRLVARVGGSAKQPPPNCSSASLAFSTLGPAGLPAPQPGRAQLPSLPCPSPPPLPLCPGRAAGDRPVRSHHVSAQAGTPAGPSDLVDFEEWWRPRKRKTGWLNGCRVPRCKVWVAGLHLRHTGTIVSCPHSHLAAAGVG